MNKSQLKFIITMALAASTYPVMAGLVLIIINIPIDCWSNPTFDIPYMAGLCGMCWITVLLIIHESARDKIEEWYQKDNKNQNMSE